MSDSRLALACGHTDDDTGGLYSYRVGEDGAFETLDRLPIARALFCAAHPDGTYSYVVTADGSIVAVEIDTDTGTLAELNRRTTDGEETCYVSVDSTGSHALVANYGSGSVAVLPIAADGRVEDATAVLEHEGSSVDPDRQAASHPHSIGPDPQNRHVYVPDLGTDRVWIYELDREEGTLDSASTPTVETHDGAGPRHFAFHPDQAIVYVVNELDSTVSTFEHDPETGDIEALDTVSALLEGYDEESYCADIHVHPSGDWVYVSNRGHDTIAVFDVEDSDTLALREHESTRGEWPRHLALDPAGEHLYAENRHTDTIVPFEIDAESGALSATGAEIEMPEPLCVVFPGVTLDATRDEA